MPTPAYMYVKGQVSGDIKGSVKVKGREDSIEILALGHEVRMPTDPQTGRLSGVRRHEPLVITKAKDKASPLLMAAACNGELLTEITINWYEIKPDGKEAIWFKHTLKNAQITGIRDILPNVKDPAVQALTHMEEVAFRYGDITWEVVDGGIMYTDNWEQSRD